MKIIDLTHLIHETMPVYPNAFAPSFQQIATVKQDGFQETKISITSHTGTHMDAPRHLFEKRTSLDEMPVSNLVGKAIVINVPSSNQEITLDMVLNHPCIQEAEFLLFYTGWDQYYETEQYMEGYPLLSIELCEWITANQIKGIGIDAMSVDALDDQTLTRHHLLLEKKDLVIIENLTNLNQLPNQETMMFIALPLHYKNADGAMARVVAIVS